MKYINVAAVVVTYSPEIDFGKRLSCIIKQVDHVVIVDNGSGPHQQNMLSALGKDAQITLLKNEKNMGIATALNQGISILKDRGYTWAVTLDQDSTPASDLVKNLIKTLQNDSNPEKVAIIGPNRMDEGMKEIPHKWLRPKRSCPFFEKIGLEKIGPEGVSIVISSGALTSLKVFDELGPFEDPFFIDFVDTEFCLRARQAGYRILVSPSATLYHRLGNKKIIKFLGLTLSPTFHEPIRRYYLFRNRIFMVRKYGFTFPHWLVYEFAATIHGLLCILICEDRKWEKLTACTRGTWDGFRGRLGKKFYP